MQNFRVLGALPPNRQLPAARGFAPRPIGLAPRPLNPEGHIGFWRLGAPPLDPQNSPPLRISGYASDLTQRVTSSWFS